LTFAYFEQSASNKGWLLELDESYSDPSSWEVAAVHDTLAEGQLIRITSQAQIFDASFFRSRLDRIRAFSKAVIEINAGRGVGREVSAREGSRTRPGGA
jgi:hypothetical protein